ncbi:hypothetical protein GUJ93_ZPchr0016g2527 [Zizania palustris]|uniref:Retrotransposon gag domain-containing protein n=1 Tax=Zizania palustris TaxID=103762 RepID=A0A8J5VVP1_ZIZPA|nr:hypothetical protein GUJ93_ZPchr0016g2527 [Zizania palustris]
MPPKKRGRDQDSGADCSHTAVPDHGDGKPSAEVESSQAESISQAELRTTMREMQEMLRILRQGIPVNHSENANIAPASPIEQVVVNQIPVEVVNSGVTLREWISMRLDSFDGAGSPIQAADWLAYIEMQLDAFEVLPRDKIRYVIQLMKGEAQIWWRGVQSARTVAHGELSWPEFVRQFGRRFYPITFLDRMQIELNNYNQGQKSVAEYEVGFNQIVRFVPHVAHDDTEKARRFRQGLRPFIRHVLGAFVVTDFCTMVEQASGIELQQSHTENIHQTYIVDQHKGQYEKKDNSGSPNYKKSKGQQRRQAYYGGSFQIHPPSTTQFRTMVKLGYGLVCFKCGDPHMQSECSWKGNCSVCGRSGHKNVVCRKNPNSRIKWEPIPITSQVSPFF